METKKNIKKKKPTKMISMSSLFTRYVILLSILVLFGVIYTIVLSGLYLAFDNIALVYAVLAGTFLFSILVIVATIVYYRTIRNTYLDEMFTKTLHNYEMLSVQRKKMVKYKHLNIKEFKELNQYIDLMDSTYKNVVLATKPVSYEEMDLEYPDPNDKHLISIKSFQLNMRNFILTNESFRDAVIAFNMETDPDDITDHDYKLLIKTINKYLPMEDKIYAISYKKGAVLVFIPNIDSISFFEEAMQSVIDESLIYDYTATGVDITKTRATMVVYPYSNIDDLMDDLRYADRQGKRVSIYLPERLNNHNDHFSHNTLTLNNLTKVFLEFNKIDMSQTDSHESIRKAVSLMKNVRVNLNFENVGTIMLEAISKEYYCTLNDCDHEEDSIFDVNKTVSKDFIDGLNACADADGSYYFSQRSHASDKIAKYIDAYGIRSGHFFLIHYHDRIQGVVFFANKNKDINLTNYGREMLFVFSTYLATFTKALQDNKIINNDNDRLIGLLRLSEIDLYTIDKSTYNLNFVSDSLNDVLGKPKHNSKCYKAIYGLDAPCENCPLKTSKKMISEIKNVKCVTSNVLSKRRSPYTSMLISHPQNEYYDTSRFHDDLLTFSSYSLSQRLNSLYADQIRGALVLISIDNYKELVEEYKNEGYFLRMRRFIDEIENTLQNKYDIFAYDDNTLAILFNEEGRIDIVGNCERIFDISQKLMISSVGPYTLRPTFIIFGFPQDYPTPVEFQRHIVRYIKSHKDLFGKNSIIVAGQKYSRPASRNAFILEALNTAFKKESLHSKIFPIIGADDKTIIGAELLLRLSDEYLNVSIPTTQFIEVARQNGLIPKISNYLIEWLGKMYQQYGMTIFKSAGLRYFSINTEISFFQDENFLNSIGEFMQTYHMPRGFLTFEIPENDIATNYEFYKSIYKRVLSYDITIACDNYSGRDISIDKLKEIGINHVKIGRYLVSKIDTDVKRFNEVREIVEDCHDNGMKVCLVGIESIQQHKLATQYETTFHRQGYLYGEPMELEEFINRLKENYTK